MELLVGGRAPAPQQEKPGEQDQDDGQSGRHGFKSSMATVSAAKIKAAMERLLKSCKVSRSWRGCRGAVFI
jgi:hypothetical protein